MAIMRLQFEESPPERASSQPMPINGKAAEPHVSSDGVHSCAASWRQLACNGLSLHQRIVGGAQRMPPKLNLDATTEGEGSALDGGDDIMGVGRGGGKDQLMAEALGCLNGTVPVEVWPDGQKCLAFETLGAPPGAEGEVCCELCGRTHPARQLAAHILRQCANVDVACPKPNCGWKGRRMFLKTHLSEVCAFVVVPCSFAASGCPARVPRGKLKSHLIEDIGNHLLLVAHENSQLRARLHRMGSAQTLLQTRVDNLETVVLVDHEEDDAADAAASEGSSA
ncbi:traf Zinc finger domain containing protein [Klebsormidium nitens]|uniref:Traf Zinc finger domain containing protein n=1 Tax=Klebsormidium nitens TaxID=105231 RepID=A0A1Y1IC78_KLENI|nr:traf Zinc finger domain containing protein [Klebsormidium nitens]|eukprot:GAQ87572.1 traf Zinc finger domain containing protein [Klebsormidium nitens]